MIQKKYRRNKEIKKNKKYNIIKFYSKFKIFSKIIPINEISFTIDFNFEIAWFFNSYAIYLYKLPIIHIKIIFYLIYSIKY